MHAASTLLFSSLLRQTTPYRIYGASASILRHFPIVGNVEMRHKPFRPRHELNDLIRQQVGLDGRDAVAFNASTSSNAFTSSKKFSPVVFPKSPMFTPVSTISFPPSAPPGAACFTNDSMVPLRLRPRANGMVQYVCNSNRIRLAP